MSVVPVRGSIFPNQRIGHWIFCPSSEDGQKPPLPADPNATFVPEQVSAHEHLANTNIPYIRTCPAFLSAKVFLHGIAFASCGGLNNGNFI